MFCSGSQLQVLPGSTKSSPAGSGTWSRASTTAWHDVCCPALWLSGGLACSANWKVQDLIWWLAAAKTRFPQGSRSSESPDSPSARRAFRPGPAAQLVGAEMLDPQLSPQHLQLLPVLLLLHRAAGELCRALVGQEAAAEHGSPARTSHLMAEGMGSGPSATEHCCQQSPPVRLHGAARGSKPLTPCQPLSPFAMQEQRQHLLWARAGQVQP